MNLLSPNHRTSSTPGLSIACLVMGRDLTCNKALLLSIRLSGCPPQRFCTCEPQWIMYVFLSSPYWHSFFRLSCLSASFWWTAEGPDQRKGLYRSFAFSLSHMRPSWSIHSPAVLNARSHSFLCLPSVTHNCYLSRSVRVGVRIHVDSEESSVPETHKAGRSEKSNKSDNPTASLSESTAYTVYLCWLLTTSWCGWSEMACRRGQSETQSRCHGEGTEEHQSRPAAVTRSTLINVWFDFSISHWSTHLLIRNYTQRYWKDASLGVV